MLGRNPSLFYSSSSRVPTSRLHLFRIRRSIPCKSDASEGLPPVCNTTNDLPPELQDLHISEDGFLVDGKTGKVINEFGATRFDVAVRALRGELSPPEWVEDTERAQGNLLGALFTFPRLYEFQAVLSLGASACDAAAREAAVRSVVDAVCSTCQVKVEDNTTMVVAKDRMGGKYVSISVQAMVRAPEIIANVYQALGRDPRVKMKF